jgi:hypothetical protein
VHLIVVVPNFQFSIIQITAEKLGGNKSGGQLMVTFIQRSQSMQRPTSKQTHLGCNYISTKDSLTTVSCDAHF